MDKTSDVHTASLLPEPARKQQKVQQCHHCLRSDHVRRTSKKFPFHNSLSGGRAVRGARKQGKRITLLKYRKQAKERGLKPISSRGKVASPGSRAVNTSKFKRNLFERLEFEETRNVEFDDGATGETAAAETRQTLNFPTLSCPLLSILASAPANPSMEPRKGSTSESFDSSLTTVMFAPPSTTRDSHGCDFFPFVFFRPSGQCGFMCPFFSHR